MFSAKQVCHPKDLAAAAHIFSSSFTTYTRTKRAGGNSIGVYTVDKGLGTPSQGWHSQPLVHSILLVTNDISMMIQVSDDTSPYFLPVCVCARLGRATSSLDHRLHFLGPSKDRALIAKKEW